MDEIELTKRQGQILSSVIHAYTQNPEPISSGYLVREYSLDFSSATIRNEMSYLEEIGYLSSPHTSAGRVPTADGYRYFVKHLLNGDNLTESESVHITTLFDSLPRVIDKWMRQAAMTLARTVNGASLVTPPIAGSNRFKHVELISIQGRLTLLVLVQQGGTVQQRMINLAEPLSQEKLSETAEQINRFCNDLTANQIRIKNNRSSILEREIIDLIIEILSTGDAPPLRVYREGLSEIINTFSDAEGAQQAVRIFEEAGYLNMILTDLMDENGDSIHVMIAGEGRFDELDRVSIVLSRYGVPGKMSGTLGVLGPTHLNYGRAISTVRHVSGLMTGKIENLYELDSGKENS